MWLGFVILCSLFNCAYYFGNQVSKVTGNIFMFYRGAVPALLLLPFLPFVTYVNAWQFYALCVVQGLVIAFIDYRNYSAMQKWGTEMVASLHPLSIGVVFILWMLLKPQVFVHYTENLYRLGGICLALIGIIYATISFQKSENSKKLLSYLWSFFLMSALCDIINKQCMSYVTGEYLLSVSYFYIMITGTVVAMVNMILYIKNKGKINELYKPHNLKYSLIILLLVGSMVSKNFAMHAVDNPSFVTATLYIYIVWIMLVGYILSKLGRKSKFRRLEGKKVFILLICAISLALLDNK